MLDGALARRWMEAAVEGLDRAKDTLDALNVFPVPDGDTGTNLLLTMRRAIREVRELPVNTPVGEVLAALARGALLGARGNSGIITSQLLLGFAQAWYQVSAANATMLARALARADEQAWTAVATPLEGTILSVTRAAARAAQASAADGGDVGAVIAAATVAAREALARTTSQLRELDEAGVVDAGGAGVVVLLDALEAVATGRAAADSLAGLDLGRPAAACAHPTGGPAFEVMYLLTADDAMAEPLRRRLGRLGDSVVVVGGSGLWHIHVHTDDVGAALAAGNAVGTPHRTRVTHLASGDPQPDPHLLAPVDESSSGVGVVVCATGEGLAEVYARAGMTPVRPQGSVRASTEEVLDAIRGCGCGSVVVLPNDPDTIPVATAAGTAAGELGLDVTVLPTRSQVQGLAAAAVVDLSQPAGDLVQLLTEAVAGIRDAAVAVASREAVTPAGRCRPGQILGLVGGEVARLGEDIEEMTLQLLDGLLQPGTELLTLVLGREAPAGLAGRVEDALRGHEVDLEIIDGGQQIYPVLLAAE